MKDKYVEKKAFEVYDLVHKGEILPVKKFIRTIVEDCKPRVSEEFVEKYYEKIRKDIGRSMFTLPIHILVDMLKEAGVEVEE